MVLGVGLGTSPGPEGVGNTQRGTTENKDPQVFRPQPRGGAAGRVDGPRPERRGVWTDQVCPGRLKCPGTTRGVLLGQEGCHGEGHLRWGG